MVGVGDAPTAVSVTTSVVNENTDTSAGLNLGALTTTDADSVAPFDYSIVGGADAKRNGFLN